MDPSPIPPHSPAEVPDTVGTKEGSGQPQPVEPTSLLSPLSKNISNILIGIILLLLGFTVGYAFDKTTIFSNIHIPFLAAKPTMTPIPSTEASTQAGTANWKAYTNAPGNYSIKYPTNWTVRPIAAGFGNATASSEVNGVDLLNPNDKNVGYPDKVITIQTFGVIPPSDQTSKKQTVTVAGIQATKIDIVLPAGHGMPATLNSTTYEIPLPGKTSVVEILMRRTPNDTQTQAIFDQILSTFKFLDDQSLDTSNWKTYTNSTWGYSFKYPSLWGISNNDDDVVNLMSNAAYLAAREKWDDSTQGPFTYPSDDYGEISFSMYKKGVNTAAGIVTDQTDIKTFVQQMFGLTYSSVTDVTLGGKPAVAFISDEMVEKPGLPPHMQNCPPDQTPCLIPSGKKIKQVWTKINGNLLYIVYGQGGSYKDIDTLPALFDQVLSTFKFTQSSTLSDSPESVVKKYLDASVKGDLATAKLYCPYIDSTALDSYGFVKYEITGSKPDHNPAYYHVYIQFTDKNGKIWDKQPHTGDQLEVLLHKNSSGVWQALTYYFYQ